MTPDLDAVKFYNPADNDYDLALDPRCLFGWGPPDCHHMFGHACFRPLGHKGKCWNAGDRKHRDDPACYYRQRPKDWDTVGRGEANK